MPISKPPSSLKSQQARFLEAVIVPILLDFKRQSLFAAQLQIFKYNVQSMYEGE